MPIPRIIAHCPVGEKNLRQVDGKDVCDYCQCGLVNLDRAEECEEISKKAAKEKICGVMKSLALPISSLALVSCADRELPEEARMVGITYGWAQEADGIPEENWSDYPEAKLVCPGVYLSPYSGEEVVTDVDLPDGSLVIDPAYLPGERKYFRIPVK